MTGLYEIGELPISVIDYVEEKLKAIGFTMDKKKEIIDKTDFFLNGKLEEEKQIYDVITSAISEFRNNHPETELLEIDAEDVFMEVCF